MRELTTYPWYERAFPGRISMKLVAWMVSLALVFAIGLYGYYVVFTEGLIVTGLNNTVVWGLWIAADISFIAFSAGAFMVSAIVYVLRIERFKPIARLAVFIGLIGYTMTVMTLVLDIGRPERFWYPLLYWNTHSVLWEVVWCITLYTGVLVVEFAPTVGDSSRLLRKLTDRLHKAMPAVVVAGIVLSLLHQTSLGALYGVVKARPLWYRPDLGMLFVVSAMASGPALVIVASMITSKIARRELVSQRLLVDLGKIGGFALMAYLFLKAWDYVALNYHYFPARAEELALVNETLYGPLFWGGEIVVGGILAGVLLLIPRFRANSKGLFAGAFLTLFGVLLFRWNATVYGLLANDLPPYVLTIGESGTYIPPFTFVLGSYIPLWTEWLTVVGVIAFGLLVYTVVVKYFRIFPPKEPQ